MVNCGKVKKIDVIYVGKTVLCNKLSKKRELKSLKDAMTGHNTNVSNDKMSKLCPPYKKLNCTEQMMDSAKYCVHSVLDESFFVYANSVESLKREGIMFYSYLDETAHK